MISFFDFAKIPQEKFEFKCIKNWDNVRKKTPFRCLPPT
ncbi:hypothetical protein BC03BB108_A0009 [Bacillus cereus 03BB108]|nr:hypothetical protein BC03BB108_B0121 [Bacillus cereus 03BB108]EDX60103.1 hypothetical protein BC03BB108_A0009 [Bacillus cereus 03BB108]